MQKIIFTLLAILLLTLSACATTPPTGLDSTESATQIAGYQRAAHHRGRDSIL
jgi:hypothetical protein